MPDKVSMPKLTPEARQQVLQWLCEGLRNAEILEKLQPEFGIEVTRQAIDKYRDRWAEEIQEAQDEAERRAKQQGLSNRLRRISLLETLAQKLGDAAIDEVPRNTKDLSPEVRALLRDIRDEYGDLKARHEHTGPNDGPIKHEHSADGLVERILRDPEGSAAAIRLAHALRDGDADAADDGGDTD